MLLLQKLILCKAEVCWGQNFTSSKFQCTELRVARVSANKIRTDSSFVVASTNYTKRIVKLRVRVWRRLSDVRTLPPALQVKPSQAKVLNGVGDLRFAQVSAPRLLAIPALDRIAGLYDRYLNS